LGNVLQILICLVKLFAFLSLFIVFVLFFLSTVLVNKDESNTDLPKLNNVVAIFSDMCPEKGVTIFLQLILLNADRFSKFFYQQT